MTREQRIDRPPAVRIRPIRPTDRAGLLALYAGLSADARYARFLRASGGISELQATGFCGPDHEHREGFVAEVLGGPDDGRLVGHLCLDPLGDGAVEMAVAVAEDHRRAGIGRGLLDGAIRWGRDHDIPRLHATMLATNTAILALVRSIGLPVVMHRPDAGVVAVEIGLAPGRPGRPADDPTPRPGEIREEGAPR